MIILQWVMNNLFCKTLKVYLEQCEQKKMNKNSFYDFILLISREMRYHQVFMKLG